MKGIIINQCLSEMQPHAARQHQLFVTKRFKAGQTRGNKSPIVDDLPPLTVVSCFEYILLTRPLTSMSKDL